MRKTSVYLTDVEFQRLGTLARRTGRTKAQLVREAIAAYDPSPQGELSFIASGAGDGTSVIDLPRRQRLAGFGE
ncbi:MAG TPA: hypothetical protein VGA69_08465 [Nitriliruptorales bacterium]